MCHCPLPQQGFLGLVRAKHYALSFRRQALNYSLKIGESGAGPRRKTTFVSQQISDRFPIRDAKFTRATVDFVQRHFANAARRRIHDTLQSDRVVLIHCQLQIRNDVPHFHPFVERKPADDVV